MTDRTHYSKAPITEAVIDLRVTLPQKTSVAKLLKMHLGEKKGYPKQRSSLLARGQMSMGARVSASATQTHNGYIFNSSDDRQIFQARLDGFAFSRLAPYDRWEPFRDEARRLWKKYRDNVHPESVNRVAVRYINRLDLPSPINDFKDYLKTVPEVSPQLPQGLSGYFMQLQIPQEDIQGTLVLNQAMMPPPKPDVVSLLLDIDLFRDRDIPQDENGIWEFFDVLQKRKDDIFEGCITDRIREMIR